MKHIALAVLAFSLLMMTGCVNNRAVSQSRNNQIAYISDLDKLWVAPKKVARFDISLNYTPNTDFAGFELKASTNNFLSAGTFEYDRLLFYSQSEVADLGCSVAMAEQKWWEDHPTATEPPSDKSDKNGSLDRMWLFTNSSYEGGDSRTYKFIGCTKPTASQPGWDHNIVNVTILVDAEAIERHRDHVDDWLTDRNNDITWVWCRYAYDSEGHPVREKEDGTNNTLWKTVTPTYWYSEMPKWATSQMSDVWPRSKLGDKMPLED